jgi:hypothetical protein
VLHFDFWSLFLFAFFLWKDLSLVCAAFCWLAAVRGQQSAVLLLCVTSALLPLSINFLLF